MASPSSNGEVAAAANNSVVPMAWGDRSRGQIRFVTSTPNKGPTTSAMTASASSNVIAIHPIRRMINIPRARLSLVDVMFDR